MRIFSTFDTEFKQKILNEMREKFGENNVMQITHWKFYYYFVVILPAIFLIIGIILYLVLLFYIGEKVSSDLKVVYYIVGFLLFLFIFGPLSLKILKRYIDYILDFVVVTPNELIYYNQEGILSRKWRTIDTEKIKTITVNKSGLIRSIFNFGNIVVLSEWDEQWDGEINFSFVDDPENLKMKMLQIIKNNNS